MAGWLAGWLAVVWCGMKIVNNNKKIVVNWLA
jgi:hypothetical protein